MKLFKLVLLLLASVIAKSETITTIGGTTETGSNGLACVSTAFSQTSNVNSSSLVDYAQFNLLAGAGCNYYLKSTLNSIGAAGTEAGFHIETANLTSLLSSIKLDTYLNGVWQESASGSNLLSLFSGGLGNVSFKTTKAYDALRINFNGLVALGNSVKIFWGYGANSSVQTLPFAFQKFTLKKDYEKARLDWEIGGNEEMERIDIQISLDNQNYYTLEAVAAPAHLFFTYVDQPISKVWYRLKATLKSGREVYSQVLFYSLHEASAITLYPNPVKGNMLFIKYKAVRELPISYVIVDAMGKKIQKGIITGELQLDITPLEKGLYYLKTNSGESMQFLRQ